MLKRLCSWRSGFCPFFLHNYLGRGGLSRKWPFIFEEQHVLVTLALLTNLFLAIGDFCNLSRVIMCEKPPPKVQVEKSKMLLSKV